MARYYPTEDTNLNIARGLVKDAEAVHKFGATPEISVGVTSTIWDKADTLYPWSAFASASILNVDSSSASDVGKSVTIVGLDASFNAQTETVTLATQTNNNTTNTFIRVYRAYMSGTAANVGDISIQVSSTDVAKILAGKSQTLMSVYTVPAGYEAFISHGAATVKYNSDMTLGMFVRYGGTGAFRITHQAEISPNGYDYKFGIPLKLTEKSDIDIRGTANTNNIRATAAWDMILIKKPIGN